MDAVIDTTAGAARRAGSIRARSTVRDVVDAIVVAEALASLPAVIVTSDPGDIRELVDTAGASRRVAVVAV